jgi:hypothetical protein
MEIPCTYDDTSLTDLYVAKFINLHINENQFKEDFKAQHLLDDLKDDAVTGLLFQNCMVQSLSPDLAEKFANVAQINFKNSSLENVEWKSFEMFKQLELVRVDGCMVELFLGTIFEKCSKLVFRVERDGDEVKLEAAMGVKVEGGEDFGRNLKFF